MDILRKAEKIEVELAKNSFLHLGTIFIENGSIKFKSRKEARKFLTLFLLLECTAGTNCSYPELWQTYQKIRKIVRKRIIYSEDLPVLPPRKHADKELMNVEYSKLYKVCTYKRICI
ncbi:MAG: hypothetical protein HFJ43_05845 [Clostridia bacterium]|nr:hypothetical protein [Clostridia bacterium]